MIVSDKFGKAENKNSLLHPIILSIEHFIDQSYSEFNRKSEEPLTILSGESGCALFYAYAFKKYQDPHFLIKTNALVDLCIDRIEEIGQPSLYQGFTGIAWLIRHLVNLKVLDFSYLSLLEDIDGYIEATIDLYSRNKYYSLMYGLIGHGIYFYEAVLNDPNDTGSRKSLQNIVNVLADISIKTPSGTTWIDNTSLAYHKSNNVIYNLGLPHGITGIVLFLSKMIDLGIEVETSKALINGSLMWLLTVKNNYSNISYYPSLIADDQSTKMTRLSWAYGDLCAALAFIKGYQHLQDEQFCSEALETVLLTAKRDIPNSIIHVNESEGSINPGICKGACGILLLYEELNKHLKNDVIDERIDFWMENLLSGRQEKAEPGAFKSYMINGAGEAWWCINPGFLEGLSGVGLTLLFMSDNALSEWRRIILL